jgi:putative FmdB family regulatory protein
MPFYDYQCTSCNHIMENQLKKYEEKLIICEKCREETAERKFSGKFAALGLPNGHIGIQGNLRRK